VAKTTARAYQGFEKNCDTSFTQIRTPALQIKLQKAALKSIDAVYLRLGADVMITNFCDFCQFSAKRNWRFP
jgi:hypothetical protein